MNNEYDIRTVIKKFDVDWMDIKEASMVTISKQAKTEPDTLWKQKMLVAQHSPIRSSKVVWIWDKIPYSISTHFARHHIGCEKYIGTQREDRTGVDRSSRSQMDLVPMRMEGNIQAVLNISERRLCTCADKLAIKYWQSLLEEIKKFDEVVYWEMFLNVLDVVVV